MGLKKRVAAMTPEQLKAAWRVTGAHIDDLVAKGFLDDDDDGRAEVWETGESFLAFIAEIGPDDPPPQ
jgi:hypothetical protein